MTHNNISELLIYKCKANAGLPFLTFDSYDYLTYGAFLQNIEKTKLLLESISIKDGKRFCIALDNTPTFLYLIFGGIFCGGVAVNLNPQLSENEFEYRLKDSGTSVFFSSSDVINRISSVLLRLRITAYVVPCETEYSINAFLINKLADNDLSNSLSKKFTLQKTLTHDSMAFLQYTGGTTGTTKAAVISHGNVISSIEQMSLYLKDVLTNGSETFIVTFPFFHVFSIVFQILTAINFSSRIILNPKVRDFKRLESILSQERFTVFVGVHTLYKMMLQSETLKGKTFPNTKLFIAGAEHIQPLTKEKWLSQTGHYIREGYGLTETTALASMSCLENSENDFDSIGLPFPLTEIKLVNEKKQEILEKEIPGEIYIKGPQVVRAYWNRPEENILAFENGWLRTGDMAIRKKNNQFKLVDRKKDMIIVSGFNVYSNEVEKVILDYPEILECAAVAKPDEKSGERVIVFYTSVREINEDSLKEYCLKYLTVYKVPVKFVKLEQIPKSPVGKTLKSLLRDIAKDLK